MDGINKFTCLCPKGFAGVRCQYSKYITHDSSPITKKYQILAEVNYLKQIIMKTLVTVIYFDVIPLYANLSRPNEMHRLIA